MNDVETTNPTIERAIEIVRGEIEITDAERRAFSRFLARLRDVDAPRTSIAATGDATEQTVLSAAAYRPSTTEEPSPTQQRVIDAYRETVVRLDHYEAEYGNDVREDVALEFGPEAVHALFHKADLTAMDLRGLIPQAEESVAERERHARELDRELESLERCDRELGDIEARFFRCPTPRNATADEITRIHDELRELERCCRDLATRRQETLHSRSKATSEDVDRRSLERYLYGQRLATGCPVLHDTVSLVRDVRSQRERCEEFLSRVDEADRSSRNAGD